ncbi:Sir2 family NAD-dependent protein deacetylase [Actinomycetospora sp. NBRC 106378]|uniref:SIR2 family NAD-dependent protein deacylase n=1 Tax=Actinomycetospora sp. NBRC 106378 TaxID=3032208 RepID=UPI0024A080F9|nr:Sir2 family NAD-dependent protein deacetylase [Actinomycetospora sp. NBRC 106378]GLZ54009.1 NAD-dependent protein deacetylase [Actinomycetospora sp. NBRC 106378]
MGVDSGLPDFRGPEGFWRAYPPYRRLGLRFEELADPEHFDDDPPLAWGFYGHRLALYRATVPHAGFGVLLGWSRRVPTQVFTSNVDGAFQAAGFPDDAVVECHGAIGTLQCTRPCTDATWPADDVEVAIDEDTMRARDPLPTCPRCGAVARPNILMFGDGSWVPGAHAERMAAHRTWLREHSDVAVIELGAGTAVPTVRRHAELASAASGRLVRVNVREPGVRHGRGVGLAAGARDTLLALDELLTDAWA